MTNEEDAVNAMRLSDLELGMILGGQEPGYQENNPNGNGWDLTGSSPPAQYGATELRADMGLLADTTGLGVVAGSAVPVVG